MFEWMIALQSFGVLLLVGVLTWLLLPVAHQRLFSGAAQVSR